MFESFRLQPFLGKMQRLDLTVDIQCDEHYNCLAESHTSPHAVTREKIPLALPPALLHVIALHVYQVEAVVIGGRMLGAGLTGFGPAAAGGPP